MAVAEGALGFVAKFVFVRRVGRQTDMQVVPVTRLQDADLRHGANSDT